MDGNLSNSDISTTIIQHFETVIMVQLEQHRYIKIGTLQDLILLLKT